MVATNPTEFVDHGLGRACGLLLPTGCVIRSDSFVTTHGEPCKEALNGSHRQTEPGGHIARALLVTPALKKVAGEWARAKHAAQEPPSCVGGLSARPSGGH